MCLCLGRTRCATLKSLTFAESQNTIIFRTDVYAHLDKYCGRPSTKVSNPLALAGALGGKSIGKASKDIITIAQYAPLQILNHSMSGSYGVTTRTVRPLLPLHTS